MLRGRLWGAAAYLLVLVASPANGQAALGVVVVDPSGARVPHVQVKVDAGGGQLRSALSDEVGEVRFLNLPERKARVTVAASGFAFQAINIHLRPGENSVVARLRLQTVREEVEVSLDTRENASSNPAAGFATVLTPEQIRSLPDDPEEMKAHLLRMAGPGAVILVDGFSATRLPPKSQIASIRIRLSSYAAEDHDFGFATIDIRTKPGFGGWHGMASFGYGGTQLNARGFFSPTREPSQTRRLQTDISGPLWKDRTSLSLWFSRSFSYDSSATIGVTSAGDFAELVRIPLDYVRTGARFLHNTSKGHRVLAEFDHWIQWGALIGQFDLPERLVNTRADFKDLKLASYGVLSGRVLNDLRFRASWNHRSSSPVSSLPALMVNGAFSAGGGSARNDRSITSFTLNEDLRVSVGTHGWAVGLQVSAERSREHNLTNANGTFVFPSLAAFEAGTPTQYSKLVGNTVVRFEQYQFAGYLQDEFRARQNLSLSVGVRWEAQTHVRSLSNFAPRFGFAWSPFRQATTSLRGGFGLFFQWIPADVYGQTVRFDGLNQDTLVILNPGFPDPLRGGTAVTLPPTLFLHDSSLRLAYLMRGSVAVHQQVRSLKVTSEVRWQRGVHLPWLNNLNQPIPGVGRPDPLAGNLYQVQNGANSFLKEWFTSLNGDFKQLLWTINYTLGSYTNEVDGPWQTPADPRNLAADKGPASAYVNHRLGGYLTVRFPVGIRLSLSPAFSSGLPYNITTGFDDNSDTAFNDRPDRVGRNTARGTGTWSVDGRLAWTRAFGPESGGGRAYEIRVDPNASGGSLDLEVPRQRFQVQTYMQVSNLFNRANFSNYAGQLTSSSFGRPTAAWPGRRMELGLRFLF